MLTTHPYNQVKSNDLSNNVHDSQEANLKLDATKNQQYFLLFNKNSYK